MLIKSEKNTVIFFYTSSDFGQTQFLPFCRNYIIYRATTHKKVQKEMLM